MLDTAPSTAVDTVLWAGRHVRIGAFRCAVEHPRFGDEGEILGYSFVFPRTAVWIQHAGDRPFLADPATVTLYNRGQEYRRLPHDPRGDHADWFSVDQETALRAVSSFEPGLDGGERPWPFAAAPSQPRVYAAQRLLFERLAGGAEVDELEVEEVVFELLLCTLAGAYATVGRVGDARVTAAHERLVERTRALLAHRFHEPLGLAELAREVGGSPFHLSRIFHRATGVPLHVWRTRLRLHAALEQIAHPRGGHDLTAVALDLGFSSHSHFTAVFRQAFGRTPSEVRRGLATRLVADLRAELGLLA